VFAWAQEPDGWYANGFRIERAASHLFVLVDATSAPTGPVSVATSRLASATTLSGCKREAEVVVAAERRTDLRRKHLSIFLLATAVGLLSIDAGFPTSLITIIVSTFLAVRSLGIICGTLLWRYAHSNGDVLYQ
jgi:hypothetical protein